MSVYKDPTRPVGERIEDLLAQMTLEEKVAQLTGVLPFGLLCATGIDEARLGEHMPNGIGQISVAGLLSPNPVHLVAMLNHIQRYLVERTRLGIPAIAHHEALAGLVHEACSDFPTAINLAAAWDPDSVQEMNDVVRRQMVALGIRQACSPVLDISRDARWGRVQETYGEDPYLASAIGVGFVRGLQGQSRADGILATGKHFLGYAMAYGGRNLGAAQLGERELLEVFARPFGAAIDVAGMESVMCSYTDLNGEPAAASRRLLTDLLRGRLGFQGTVVADYGAVNGLYARQQTADTLGDAGVQALSAGLDVELPGGEAYTAGLARAVRAGELDLAVVDRSVRLVLDAKFRLGLFEQPYGSSDQFAETVNETSLLAARRVARTLATRSTVLLANPSGLLPLSRDLPRIAVIGPNASSVRNFFGGYSTPMAVEMLASGDMGLPVPAAGAGDDEEDHTAMEAVTAANAVAESGGEDDGEAEMTDTGKEFGFVRRIASRPSEAGLAAVEAIWGDVPTVVAAIRDVVSSGTEVVYALGCHVNDFSTDGIAEAVAAAQGSDVAILVLGDKTGLAVDAVVGETRDRSTLELAGAQRPLLEAVCATGVPVVVVLIGSQPVPVYAEPGGPAAVVFAYQPGSVGGAAVADVLFGIESPSGRIPITIPRTAGQCPIYHGHKQGSDPSTYTDLEDSGPAYAFGHGLTYTTMEYRSIQVDSPEVAVGGAVKVRVEVANTGTRSGEEVVQLYARIARRGVTRPIRELIGFQRVALAAGEAATVTFDVQPAILAYYDFDMNLVMTPGDMTLMAGPASNVLSLSTRVRLTGDALTLASRTVHLTKSTVSAS